MKIQEISILDSKAIEKNSNLRGKKISWARVLWVDVAKSDKECIALLNIWLPAACDNLRSPWEHAVLYKIRLKKCKKCFVKVGDIRACDPNETMPIK
jgi:hypothetical protein